VDIASSEGLADGDSEGSGEADSVAASKAFMATIRISLEPGSLVLEAPEVPLLVLLGVLVGAPEVVLGEFVLLPVAEEPPFAGVLVSEVLEELLEL